MSVTKETKLLKIHINEQRELRCEYVTIYKKDGKEISRGQSSELVVPDEDISQKSDKIKKVGNALFTPATKAKQQINKLKKLKENKKWH